MMSLRLRNQWAGLREQRAGGSEDGYRLRFMTSRQDVRVYAAITEAGLCPAIVIEIPRRVRLDRIASTSGRVLEIRVAEFAGLSPDRYGVALELHDQAYEDLFERLGEDIISAITISATGNGAEEAIATCIERWRSFIERSRQPMSDEAIRGLAGELTVLGRCLGHRGEAASIEGWVGPLGGLRDFRLSDASVEVKTFQSDTGASLRFNDPQQLDSDGPRPVYVAAIPLARHETRGIALSDMVIHIRNRLTSQSDSAQVFEERLAHYGYVDAYAAQLGQRFLIGPLILYRIESGFPRIKAADVPPGVENVHFSVALAGLRPYVADAETVLGTSDPVLEIQEG